MQFCPSESSILSFPPEITAVIFRFCLPTPPSTPGNQWNPRPSPLEAPLLLAQICCQWRDICLGTPDLWTSVAFDKGYSQLLELWLSRAGNYPLTISLRTRIGDEARACLFLQAISRRSSQWQEVHLELPLPALQQLNALSFPRLERLALFTSQSTEDFPIIIRDTPLLRHASIRSFHQINLPWEQLTTLHFLDCFDIAQTVAILRCCPNVQEIYFPKQGNGSFVLSPVELRSLRSLRIVEWRVLYGLTIPRLERLEVLDDNIAAVVLPGSGSEPIPNLNRT
ncbi:hypothetical protein K438DRAFT_2008633 [Mycena galopus ATCC 62051]|nr:hypothetical protein K438DRAFT_2008633 [Mycena galopus ATCC 62051]